MNSFKSSSRADVLLVLSSEPKAGKWVRGLYYTLDGRVLLTSSSTKYGFDRFFLLSPYEYDVRRVKVKDHDRLVRFHLVQNFCFCLHCTFTKSVSSGCQYTKVSLSPTPKRITYFYLTRLLSVIIVSDLLLFSCFI